MDIIKMAGTLLRLCLLLASLTGYVFFLIRRCQVRMEFAPAITCAWASNLLFAAGLWNLLPQAVWLLLLGGLILFVRSFQKKFLPDKRSLLLFCGFVCIVLYFFWLFYGVHITSYDNFSHWATVVKDMLLNDRMPNFEDTVIRFQSYPLGSSLFLYAVCKIVGPAEGCMLWAQLLMLASCLFCMSAFVKKRTLWQLPALGLMALWMLTVNNSIYELRVDTLLPVTGVAVFAVLYAYRGEPKKAWVSSMGLLILLIQIKNSGIFFYAVCIVYAFFAMRKSIWQYRLHFFGAGLFAPLFAMYLWKRHVAFAFSAGMDSKHSMNLAHFEEVAAQKTAGDIQKIGIEMLKRLTQLDNIEVKLLLFYIVFFCVLAIVLRKSAGVKKVLCLLAANGGCMLLYLISLFAMYVFSMPLGEAVNLASYERYVLSVVIFICGVTIVVLFDLIDVPALISAAGAAVFLFAALLVCQNAPRMTQLYEKPKFAGTKRSYLQAQIRKNGLKEGDSCLICCAGTDDDRRYFFYLTRYELWSDKVLSIQKEDFSKYQDQIASYDAVITWEPGSN